MAQAVKVRWIADFNQLIREQKRFNEEQEKTNKKTKDNTAETRKWERMARAALRSVETAQERYNRKLGETREMMRRGLITDHEKVRQLVKSYAEELDNAGNKQERTFGSTFVRRLGAIATGYIGISRAMGLVTREMQEQQSLQDRRTETQLSTGAAVNQLIRNLPGQSPAQIEQTIAATRTMAEQLGVSERKAFMTMSSAVSAAGGNVQMATAASRQALEFFPEGTPEEVALLAGAIGDIQSQLGMEGSEGARAALGLFSFGSGKSRVVKPRAVAATLPSAIANLQEFGGDVGTTTALFSALTVGGAEPFGERSRTAAIALGQQLDRFFTEEGLQEQTLAARIQRLQGDQDLARAFFERPGTSFERGASGIIRGLLMRPDSAAARQFQETMAAIPQRDLLAQRGTEIVQNLQLNPFQAAIRMDQQLGAIAERARAGGGEITGLSSAQLRNIMDVQMLTTGQSELALRTRRFLASLPEGAVGTTQIEEAIGLIQDNLATRAAATAQPVVAGGPGGAAPAVATTDEARVQGEQRAILIDMRDALLEALDVQKEMNDKTDTVGERAE